MRDFIDPRGEFSEVRLLTEPERSSYDEVGGFRKVFLEVSRAHVWRWLVADARERARQSVMMGDICVQNRVSPRGCDTKLK